MEIKQYHLIKQFVPSETKMEFLTDALITQPLYLPDEYRNRKAVIQLLLYYLYGSRSLMYEFGNWSGLIGFIDIIPTYKCSLIMKIWDKGAWGPDLCREIKRFMDDTMRLYDLRRISVQSASESGTKMLKLFGFVIEGRQKYGFRWNGKLMTNTMLRKIREV